MTWLVLLQLLAVILPVLFMHYLRPPDETGGLPDDCDAGHGHRSAPARLPDRPCRRWSVAEVAVDPVDSRLVVFCAHFPGSSCQGWPKPPAPTAGPSAGWLLMTRAAGRTWDAFLFMLISTTSGLLSSRMESRSTKRRCSSLILPAIITGSAGLIDTMIVCLVVFQLPATMRARQAHLEL